MRQEAVRSGVAPDHPGCDHETGRRDRRAGITGIFIEVDPSRISCRVHPWRVTVPGIGNIPYGLRPARLILCGQESEETPRPMLQVVVVMAPNSDPGPRDMAVAA